MATACFPDWKVRRAIAVMCVHRNNLDLDQLALALEIDMDEAFEVFQAAMQCRPGVTVDLYSKARAH